MGCNTVFGNPVHLVRPNLDLNRFSIVSDDRRMEGLVHVCLWQVDIVLEFSRNGCPHGVDDAQGLVTIFVGVYNDPEAYQVIDLLKVKILGLHFLVYAGDFFRAPRNFGCDSVFVEFLRDNPDNFGDVSFTLTLPFGKLFLKILMYVRMKILKGEFLQF